jgi:2-polyprenyl-6-methoxyphenol hydroxylase-like FAD-dependent oxidoreductase
MKTHETEVLIVGAGPVGLLTAVILSQAGVRVEIIDREERSAARSYACALHPSTLDLLDQFGLSQLLVNRGRQIRTMAFYDGPVRQVDADFKTSDTKFPFILVLPQSELEEILETKLRRGGIAVHWNHRFDDLRPDEDSIVATLEELEGTAMGYIVPHWETIVKKRFCTRARFVVGADGHNSLVRKRLGIGYQKVAPAETFVACEFSSETTVLDELRIVLNESTSNAFWPMPDNKLRWTFQLIHSEPILDFPEKERRAVRFGETLANENIRRNLLRLSGLRAPWFSADVNEILWCKQVPFERGLAQTPGMNRAWLVGDSAHQTGPIGVQSLNAGLLEANALARCVEQVLKDDGPMGLLASYGHGVRDQWLPLIGANGLLRPRHSGHSWLARRANRIVPCLPAVGDRLPILAQQLGLELVRTDKVASQALEAT